MKWRPFIGYALLIAVVWWACSACSVSKTNIEYSVLQRPVVNKTPEQHHASLIVFVGRLMALCFTFTVMAFIYGILFVDQPTEQAPTDAQLIDLLSTLLVFLTGTLSGLVASNGLKSKPGNTTEG